MNSFDLATKLYEIGYSLSLDGEMIKFHYNGPGEPPEEARGLLEEIRAHKAEITLLKTPMRNITKPLPVKSDLLNGEIIYLVCDEEMASEIEKQGMVAFTPEEIVEMGALERSMSKEQWVSHLKAVFQAKKVFEGSRVIR